MVAQAVQRPGSANLWQRLNITLISFMFLALGAGAIIALIFSVLSNTGIFTAPDASTALLRFLIALGVVRPLLLIVGGIASFRLGRHLLKKEINAARWARLVLLWLLILVAVAVIQGFDTRWASQQDFGMALRGALPWILLAVALAYVFLWLTGNIRLYSGLEDARSQQTRSAWNLILPTLVIFGLLAILPLEQVFITSLTDAPFARNDPVNLVGGDNYAKLFGVRADIVPCEKDNAGACKTDTKDGKTTTVFMSARDFVGGDYTKLRYREVLAFDILGKHLVISARDEQFVGAVISTFLYAIPAVVLQVTIGLAMAMLIATQMRGITLMRLAVLFPLAIPTLIATRFWDIMFNPTQAGLLNALMVGLGIVHQPQAWLTDPILQIPALILVIVWKETPSAALLLLPALVMIPRDVYEAAEVDGAGRLQRFFRITLPMMRPAIAVTVILRTMTMLRVFDIFDIFLGRNRFSMATYTYNTLLEKQQLGYSSAISVSIFLIILFFTVIYLRAVGED